MHTHNTQRGISIFAAILIIAIIGVGGYAVYNNQVKKSATIELDDQMEMEADMMLETVDELEADVTATLGDVRAQLALKTDAGIAAAAKLLSDLEARLEAKANTLSADAQEKTQVFKRRIGNTRARVAVATTTTLADVEAEIADIEAEVEDAFDDIEMTVEAEIDAMLDSEDDSDDMMNEEGDSSDDDVMMEDDSDPSDDDSMMMEDEEMSDDGTTVEVEAEGETSAETGDEGTEVDSETEVEVTVE